MKRLVLATGIFLVMGLLAGGTFSALADKGGPGHGADHGVASGLQDGADDGVVAQQGGQEEGAGEEAIAQAVADEFDVSAEDVMALHDEQHIGWGALFKLFAIAEAKGITVEQLLAGTGFTAEGKHDFAFGEMMNELTEAQLATLESGPKNLGELVSEAHHEGEGGASDQGNGHAFGRGHGTGQPEGVPAGE